MVTAVTAPPALPMFAGVFEKSICPLQPTAAHCTRNTSEKYCHTRSAHTCNLFTHPSFDPSNLKAQP